MINQKPNCYIDMDGVLCDFNTQCRKVLFPENMSSDENINQYLFRTGKTREEMWKYIRLTQGLFWESIPPLLSYEDTRNLIPRLLQQGTFQNIFIITSPRTRDPFCRRGKRRWVEEHMGRDVNVIFISNKSLFAKTNGCANVLIDDNPLNICDWQLRGGIGMLFTGRNTWERIGLGLGLTSQIISSSPPAQLLPSQEENDQD